MSKFDYFLLYTCYSFAYLCAILPHPHWHHTWLAGMHAIRTFRCINTSRVLLFFGKFFNRYPFLFLSSSLTLSDDLLLGQCIVCACTFTTRTKQLNRDQDRASRIRSCNVHYFEQHTHTCKNDVTLMQDFKDELVVEERRMVEQKAKNCTHLCGTTYAIS